MAEINLSNLPDKAPDYDLRDLLEAGCHFGHQRNKWNPKMAEYIYADKEGFHVFDLAKTAEQLKLAYNYFYQLGKQGKRVIMVGTKRQAREIVEAVAKKSELMYISSRWLGGFLTNWEQVKKSLDRLTDMKAKFANGEYDAFTKFEQAQLKKEVTRLERFFAGISDLTSPPDVLFIVDPIREKIAVKEAILTNVPVVGMVDTDGDPELLDLVIPANEDASKSIEFVVEQIGQAYLAGKNS